MHMVFNFIAINEASLNMQREGTSNILFERDGKEEGIVMIKN